MAAAPFINATGALFTGAYWAFRFFESLGFAVVFLGFIGVHFNLERLSERV